MLKILPIIPSSTSQKITHYFHFILILLPIITYYSHIILYTLLFFRKCNPEKHMYELDTYFVVDSV